MKVNLHASILLTLITIVSAQQPDSLRNQSTYKSAWETAMRDGKITDEERMLMNVFSENLKLPPDSVNVWEAQWGKGRTPIPPKTITAKDLDQSGRWPLVLQNIVIGSGLYGWAVPYVLNAEDGRWYVGSEMISMGSAFYLTYKYTKNMEMSHARAQMMRYGSLLGLRYGAGINQILDLYADEGDDRETLWAWVLMGSVPAGLYGGERLFDQYQPSNGQAWAWTMWTGVAGITARAAHSVLNEAPEEPVDSWDIWGNYDEAAWTDYDKRVADWEKQKTIVELMAYPVGIWAGQRLIRDKQYTFGDALMLTQGWGFGFFNTMMLQSLFLDSLDAEEVLVSSLGAIGSVFAYDRWIADEDYSFGQSTLMLLGSASGTAFGFGTAILLDIQDKPMLAFALAGYGTGTWLTRKILDVKPDGALAHTSSTKISLNPAAMAVSRSDHKPGLIPALSLNMSFK
ncbi:MAG: hypothetical protein K9N35_02495 [Candidatus Marinimicrobia bacterium]|nr:hypothetical protein [Candidatus Neomarinimicrobiota bacterium]